MIGVEGSRIPESKSIRRRHRVCMLAVVLTAAMSAGIGSLGTEGATAFGALPTSNGPVNRFRAEPTG